MNIIGINCLLFGKAIVTAQGSLSSNYCLRVTAGGVNQNAQRPFFNTKIIVMLDRILSCIIA
jgi:hypothetical protein